MEDLRVVKDQNRALKNQLHAEQKKSSQAHEQVIRLEQTVRRKKEHTEKAKKEKQAKDKVSLCFKCVTLV